MHIGRHITNQLLEQLDQIHSLNQLVHNPVPIKGFKFYFNNIKQMIHCKIHYMLNVFEWISVYKCLKHYIVNVGKSRVTRHFALMYKIL